MSKERRRPELRKRLERKREAPWLLYRNGILSR